MPPVGRQFKVKLLSGRILGPLGIDRVRRLIKKKHLTGTEVARVYPNGDWVSVFQIEEISQAFIDVAQCVDEGKLRSEAPIENDDVASPVTSVLPGATQVLPDSGITDEKSIPKIEIEPEVQSLPIIDVTEVKSSITSPQTEDDELTEQEIQKMPSVESLIRIEKPSAQVDISYYPIRKKNPIAEAVTVIFQRSENNSKLPGKPRISFFDRVKGALIGVVLGVLGYQFFLQEPPKSAVKWSPIRPLMPAFQDVQDPQKSSAFYTAAMKSYLQDTVSGYIDASNKLLNAAALDRGNVKALAMLASSYLNLIDSSNKDENYFRVISKLIEMSRAKNLDLPETVIADVEYYIFSNKAEAAQNRIVEYSKTHQVFGREMFYYLALAFYYRGDFQNSARYLSQISENQVFSAKLFYLRGQLAEKLDQTSAAIVEFEKAIKFNPSHARSRLKLAELMNRQSQLVNAESHLEYLVSHARMLSPKDMAQGYYLHSLLSQIHQKWDIALGDMERAVILDNGNHDYLLEMYTLRSKAGDRHPAMKTQGRMYYFLSEGEMLLRAGKVHDALIQFLSARQANEKSPVPLIKIGDLFARLHQLQNARMNYKLAADLAPNNIEIWSKYIDVLIRSYEWDDASRAMSKFRSLPVPQGAIDKAAADMFAKQGRYAEAINFYQKAMARDSIDPSVYLAYAQALVEVQNYKDAPFFFALALRFDPLNTSGLIGTAQCVAATESIDRAISMLHDELQKDSVSKAEILAGIAEFQIQKGEWDQAQKTIDDAKISDPDYAYAWKIQAQIYINQEGSDRLALDKALQAYQSYSDRNTSDASGYLERYKIFIKKTEFEKAADELDKIFAIYPKYPNLHFYKGSLYRLMRNHQRAMSEYQSELKNNPSSILALKGLAKEYVDAGAPAEGLKYLSKAMELNPKDPEAKADAAYANYLLKNYTGAIGLYQAALVYDPANPILYKRMGIAYRDAGDQSAATRAFRKYLEMEPDAPDRAEFQRYQ